MPLIVLGSVTGAALWWCRLVLVDEDRYLRAVAPLARSPRFARIAAWVVALGLRHRGGWRCGVSPRTARAAALLSRRSMATRSFRRAWISGHRWVHRLRTRGIRLRVAMLSLAALGTVVGTVGRIRAVTAA